MPLLPHILEELDRELVRLQEIRSIVAGLNQSPSIKEFSPALVTEAGVAPSTEKLPEARKRRQDAGRLREAKVPRSRPVGPQRALATAIPDGPVVFNPSRLSEERAQRLQKREVENRSLPLESSEDLEALSRSLAARWSTGLVQ